MPAEWPDLHGKFVDPGAEEEFQLVMAIVEEVRGHRQAAGAPPRGGRLHLDRSVSDTIAHLAARLANVDLVDVLEAQGTPLAIARGRVSFPAGSGDARREKERKRLEEDLTNVATQLAHPDCRDN